MRATAPAVCVPSHSASPDAAKAPPRLNFTFVASDRSTKPQRERRGICGRHMGLIMSATNKAGFRVIFGALVAASVLGAAATVKASMPHDGRWNVAINSSDADCRTAIPLRIENGRVGYNGYVPVNVSGSVGGNGAVTVSVNGGGRRASASGQLSGNSGSGTWSGSSADNKCHGTWTAARG